MEDFWFIGSILVLSALTGLGVLLCQRLMERA
jgi:hypothetical protein